MSATITNMSGGITPVLPSVQLEANANYLYALCGAYSLDAARILNYNTGGGSVVIGGGGQIISPIKITSSDFANATDWDGENIYGINIQPYYTLQVYADSMNQRFLNENTEWVRTSTGVKILLDGFDATIYDYTIYIYIST